MAATLLDAVTSSNTGLLTTGVVSAGSNRWALYIPLFTSGSNAGGASSVTLGGQSMTLLAEADATDRDVAIQLWVLNEAGIAAMSGTTIVTTGGGSDDEGAYFLSIQDANQTLPSGANVNSGMFPSTSSGNLSLTRQADSWTFLAGLQDYEFSALSLGNPTHTNQITFKNGSGSVGYQADTANTSDCTFSGGAARDTGLVAANFVGAATGPEINTMDNPVRLGSTSAHTVSNFGSTINAGNVARDGIQLDGTSPSDTAITWAAQAQNLVTPSAGTGATVTLGDGTDTANATREFLPETGSTWNAVGTVSGSLVEGDWGFGLGLESSQDAYITRDSDSAIATHNDDGTTTWLDYGTSLVYTWDKNAVIGSDGGWTSNTLTNSENPTDVPVLATTKALSGIIDQSFSKTLTIQSGDPATSWTITGGADQAEYSLSNAGVLTRDVPNPTEESEVITVTASNAGGTSNTQTVTITYTASSIPATKFRRFPWQGYNKI